MTDRTAWSVLARHRDGLAGALEEQGIDPNRALSRTCETCGGDGRVANRSMGPMTRGTYVDPCPNPRCKDGQIEVARIMVVPVEVAEWLDCGTLDIDDEPTDDEVADLHAAIAEDARALRIGRRVATTGDGEKLCHAKGRVEDCPGDHCDCPILFASGEPRRITKDEGQIVVVPIERSVTLDDLWRLAYFTGKPVTLTVGGGHDTSHRVHFGGRTYDVVNDRDELLAAGAAGT